MLALLVLAVVLHRPLLHGLIEFALPRLAARAGLEITFNSSGSIWSDLVLRGIHVSGSEDHWLPRLEAAQISTEYDWRAIRRGDWKNAVCVVELRAAEVRLDLRRWPSTLNSPPKKLPKGKDPTLIWPEVIDLNGVDLEVTLADGSVVRVTGFRLRQSASGTGELAWSELAWVPAEAGSAALLFPPARARLEKSGRQLRITALDLPYEARLEVLTLDLDRFEEGVVAMTLELARASARLQAAATLRDVWLGPVSVEAESNLTGLHARELTGTPLPAGWSFENAALRVTASGQPANWAAMEVEVELEAEALELAARARLDSARLSARLHEGRLNVHDSEWRRGGNEVRLQATANLGEVKGEIAKAAWQAEVEADLPEVDQLMMKRADVGEAERGWAGIPLFQIGSARAQGSAGGKGARLEEARLALTGVDWGWAGYRWPEPRLEVELAGEQLRLTLPETILGEGNRFSAEAVLALNGLLPLEASWRLQCESLPNFLMATGLPVPPQTVSGELRVEGSAQADLTRWMEGEWSGVKAQTSVEARNLRFQADAAEVTPAGLESLELKLIVEEGLARVERGLLRLDAENEVTITGQTGLVEPRAFEVEALVKLPRLAALETLLRHLTTAAPVAGSLQSEVRVQGKVNPWQCDGRVELTAKDVTVPGLPDALDAELSAVFAGTHVDIVKLMTRSGPWSARMRAEANPEWVSVENVELRFEEALLAQGRARYPFDLLTNVTPPQADFGPLELQLDIEDLAVGDFFSVMGVNGVPAGRLNAKARLDGRLSSLQGAVEGSFEGSAPLVAGVEPPAAKMALVLSEGRLSLKAEARQAPLEPLTLEAALPFPVTELIHNPAGLLEQPIEATLSLPESRLDALARFPAYWAQELPARLRVEAAVSGTLASPRLQAEVDLRCTEILLARPDLPSVRDVVVRLRASGQEIRLEEFSMLLAGGRLRASGRVGIASLLNPVLDLELNADEALVFRDPSTSLRANAALRCQGPLDAARLSGRVELVRGRFFKDIDVTPTLRLPSDAPALPPAPEHAFTQLELPSFFADWQFAIDVVTRDPILLSGNLINGAVSVRAAIGGTGVAPLFTGGATVDRMLLRLPFSVVRVTHGQITLRPDFPFDPHVNVRAESRVPSHFVAVFANGPVSNVRTRFTSSPPLSETDITTLLVTGTTLSGDGVQVAADAVLRGLYLYLSSFYRNRFNQQKVIDETPPRFHIGFAPSSVGTDRAVSAMQATYDFNDRWRLSGQFAPSGQVRAALGILIRFGKSRSNLPQEASQP